jgi:predicted nucleic acid-binding protein
MYPIGEMSLTAWEAAAEIYGYTRKAGNSIEDTDILLAAFCIVNNYTLVTNNEKHFKGIDGLIFENWSNVGRR